MSNDSDTSGSERCRTPMCPGEPMAGSAHCSACWDAIDASRRFEARHLDTGKTTMTGNNLPDDVTPSMVDDAMAPPEQDKVMGTVTVLVDEEIPEYYDDAEAVRALMTKLSNALEDAEGPFDVVDGEVEERWRMEGI